MSAYVHSAAFDTGTVAADDIHSIHYEQYGKQDGKPVIFLHGGPGVGTVPSNASFFDPAVYRVVLMDQRGVSKSSPQCELRKNTTAHLIEDIESLREHLGITKWHLVFGGSWGSTLALLYAEAYPDALSSLILRGIFLFRQSELDWGHPITGGASQVHPDVCDEFLKVFTEEEKRDWERVIYQRLLSDDRAVRVKAARDLNTFDFKRGSLLFSPESLQILDNEAWSLHHATLLMHYIVNNGFIREGQILEEDQLNKIKHLPCTIVQGRYDMVCPPQAAWDLHRAWPEAKLIMVPDAGHVASEPGTFKELVNACNEFANL